MAFGHLEYPTVPLQFSKPADRLAAAMIPASLDGLRKKERLRELYRQHPSMPGDGELAVLAAIIGPQAGLDEHTALAWLTLPHPRAEHLGVNERQGVHIKAI